MWFLVIFLLVVIAVGAWVIFELNKAKNRFKTHAEGLQKELLVMSEKGVGLYEQINVLKDQVDDLKNQRESVNQMVKLGLLKVEDIVLTKKQLDSEMSQKENDESNVIYLGRHA